jgi:hypothetical protein
MQKYPNLSSTLMKLLLISLSLSSKLSRAGSAHPFVEMAEKGEHISLGLCVSASGQSLRPLVILPLKQLPTLSPEVLGFYAVSGSDTGFMTKEIW